MMTINRPISLLLPLVLFGAVMAGCSGEPAEQGGTDKATGQPAPAPAKPIQAEFGKQQAAGHMEFTLTTEPEQPKAGDVNFVAKIGHHGAPHDSATVKVLLSGPANAEETAVTLNQTFFGTYEGKTKLTDGDWEAKVDVSDGHDAQSFIYRLSVEK